MFVLNNQYDLFMCLQYFACFVRTLVIVSTNKIGEFTDMIKSVFENQILISKPEKLD